MQETSHRERVDGRSTPTVDPVQRRRSLDDGWTVKPKVASFVDIVASRDAGTPVTLPHDAMRDLDRSAEGGEGPWSGYFPGGTVEYTRSILAPEQWRGRHVAIEFDGVYRDAMVFVNDAFAGQRPGGYVPFRIPLEPYLRVGEVNTIRVEARAHEDSRWYSGLGIFRDVALLVTPLVHIAPDGVRVSTLDSGAAEAMVEVSVEVRNDEVALARRALRIDLRAPGGESVAGETVPVTVRPGTSATVRRRFYLREPALWGVDRPALHRAEVVLLRDGEPVDEETVRFGVRTLRLDPAHGLRINGEEVTLRGACIHHDNGVLGAAAIGRAEERRVELLKAAGFNAIRSAHNPASTALLEACDRLGVLVVDEAFDMWFEGMRSFDYSLDFAEWWERDLAAMVGRDANHPCVVAYSIGNEVPEAGTPAGASWSRDIAQRIHDLDPMRYTTNAVSSFWAVSGELRGSLLERVADLEARGVNDVMNGLSEYFEEVTRSQLVTDRTEETHSTVDIAGLNYAHDRYLSDGERFPHRVMLGTENTMRDIPEIWELIERLPYVIGDFTWTGWDYLGEAGIGRTEYPEASARTGGDPDWPWLAAWCGDIDITGHRRPASYYREIVWGLRHEPYIAVLRPERHGKRSVAMQWAWSDSVSSWTWDVAPGSPVRVEVYSDADEVELTVNGRVVGCAPAGRSHRYIACFETTYEPGTLTAVARSGGTESRTVLHTAGRPQLWVEPDRAVLRADHTDLAFVDIELRDTDGNLASAVDREVSVEVTGAAHLAGLGAARPATEERFDSSRCTTFDGRALAVVRPAAAGSAAVTVRCEGLAPVTVQLEVQPA